MRPPPPSGSSLVSQTTSTNGHVITAAKLLSSNLTANLVWYAIGKGDKADDDKMDEGKDDEEASLSKDAAKCMCLGNQLDLSDNVRR